MSAAQEIFKDEEVVRSYKKAERMAYPPAAEVVRSTGFATFPFSSLAE